MYSDQTISNYQPLLRSIAMRMVGSIEDAEDIVQDTFLKWLTIDTSKVTNTKAYLIKSVTNNCLNHLNALKRKKDELLDSTYEFIEKNKDLEITKFDLENEISEALVVMHKKLEPLEKAIYLLREVFNFEYDELQVLFDKKKDNCRQLLSRAKEKLNQEKSRFSIDFAKHTQMLESFQKACDLGHVADLVQDLGQDIVQRFNSPK
ncbi:MAG: sigma-70 family RNA polymerase sigma factor [Bacteroidetes bacterium]|nr:sigma-70 family RNA polymerase sigma factor [Bacteroidota bacterium]MDA1119935.1 sigma-70 family RNA polymerase sigma factor [Bacteroidota bacterium]